MNKILNRNLNKVTKTLSISFIKIGKGSEKVVAEVYLDKTYSISED